ncbi:class D sortase [Clostridium botulinum]|uniref:class D sortase n=1 Tax=Clostridium TaxID=1485 RepID=UPI00090B3C45|nr:MULTISPECIES: class D sortase [Clostridium]APF25978.1 sortase family protein [Clostridium sporogenes]MBD5640203.1 class D sortase [Clostridium botulinum]MDI6918451.1 class D sortase [Clostridium botulinum]WMU99000.1 class D sortase [Clostridium botulinum]
MKRNIISSLFIIIGLVLMVSSLGIRMYSKNKETQLIKEFNNDIDLENSKNDDKNHDKNYGKQKRKTIKYTNGDGDKIAIMEIPSISLQSIIVEGTNMDDLRYYLGHFKDTAMPGINGNFSIAGHSSTIYNEILNELYKVNVRDEIKIKTLTGEYDYIITKKFVVEPSEIGVLDQDQNKKSMTIVTCTDKGKKRLIVKAEMKK